MRKSQARLLQELDFKAWVMTNIWPKDTGLPATIWIQPFTGRERHGPQLRIQITHGKEADLENTVAVTISARPRILKPGLSATDAKLVKEFVVKNKLGLLDVWADRITPVEFCSKIKRVKNS